MLEPVEIFFSYAHEDEELMNDVRRQLIVEERNGRIVKWHDRRIPPGTDWRAEIDLRLERSSIVLLFLSPHFIESRYCYEVEGQAALRRHDSGSARVIPIILRPCLWDRSPYARLQVLTRDATPVSTWTNRDEACLDVARGVMVIVDELSGRSVSDATSVILNGTLAGRLERAATTVSEWKRASSIDELRANLRDFGVHEHVADGQTVSLQPRPSSLICTYLEVDSSNQFFGLSSDAPINRVIVQTQADGNIVIIGVHVFARSLHSRSFDTKKKT